MSIYQPRQLTCPTCKTVTERSVAVSLNASRAQAVRRAILDNTFQRFTCEACGSDYIADGPLIYLDFDAKHWLAVFPRGWERTWRAHEAEPMAAFRRNILEHSPPLVQQWAPGFVVRAVFGLAALREKLVCFDADVDDRALEVLKLDFMRSSPELEFQPSCRPRLVAIEAEVVRFEVPVPPGSIPGAQQGRLARVNVPRARLDDIVRNDDGQWTHALTALAEGPYVDVGRLLIPGHPATHTSASA